MFDCKAGHIALFPGAGLGINLALDLVWVMRTAALSGPALEERARTKPYVYRAQGGSMFTNTIMWYF